MGVATGCGCKEVYRFLHTTYPYSSGICSFLQQHPYFLNVFCYGAYIRTMPDGAHSFFFQHFLVIIFFMYSIIFSPSINYGRPTAAI